jgi:NitT/TauT family transport system permease protein
MIQRSWGYATALFHRLTRLHVVDVAVLVGVLGALAGLYGLAREWTAPHRPTVQIDLDNPLRLVEYTFYSLCRGLIAYVFSLIFTLLYGYWAAKDAVAERVLVPLLDILQSIPVLSFLPGLVLALDGLFPTTNIGLELAAILMIFTGQAWNMTFSFYHSLRSVPPDLQEVSTVYRFTWWQRLKWLELPFAAMGLVWNSMMSMAGGWFFLMINEAFRLGKEDYRLPGIGAYMSVAVDEGRYGAMVAAIVAMIAMIVLLDQLLWRPVVVWAQKFRMEEGGHLEAQSSWFLDWLRHSRLMRWLSVIVQRRRRRQQSAPAPASAAPDPPQTAATASPWGTRISLAAFLLLAAGLLFGAWKLLELLREVSLENWGVAMKAAGWTLVRVLAATALGTLWALPAGLAIGLSPRLARILQPVVQVMASFPAPMLFPVAIALMQLLGVSLNWWSVLLMLLGTQWYILFNVVAGAMAIPADLREAATSFALTRWQRFRALYLPAVFPYLVTGWVTAAGGAWNASIVAEFVTFKGEVIQAHGLGALISMATEQGNFPLLAASTLVMALVVVVFNRTVWRSCYNLAERRYSMAK